VDSGRGSEVQIFQKHDTRLHGGSGSQEVLTSEYLRKYIIYVRRRWVRVAGLCSCLSGSGCLRKPIISPAAEVGTGGGVMQPPKRT